MHSLGQEGRHNRQAEVRPLGRRCPQTVPKGGPRRSEGLPGRPPRGAFLGHAAPPDMRRHIDEAERQHQE